MSEFYRRLNEMEQESRIARIFNNRPADLHDYQGCANDAALLICGCVGACAGHNDTPAMNTKGVEDGTNEVCKWCGCVLPIGMYATCFKSPTRWCERPAAVPVANLDELLRNVRSATPEELTAQRESYGRNYKPGPRQATPFMPEVPVESATAHQWSKDGERCLRCGDKDWMGGPCKPQPVESTEELPPLPATSDPFETLRNTARWCMAASRQDWEDDLIEIKMAASAAPKTILALFAENESLKARLRTLPVPERTAEMEELIGRLRQLNGRGVLLYSSEVKILLDHIEGQPK